MSLLRRSMCLIWVGHAETIVFWLHPPKTLSDSHSLYYCHWYCRDTLFDFLFYWFLAKRNSHTRPRGECWDAHAEAEHMSKQLFFNAIRPMTRECLQVALDKRKTEGAEHLGETQFAPHMIIMINMSDCILIIIIRNITVVITSIVIIMLIVTNHHYSYYNDWLGTHKPVLLCVRGYSVRLDYTTIVFSEERN